MVGGSASYLGIVPELEIGVIVLTNTAKSVDAIGTRILSKMIKLTQQRSQRTKRRRKKRFSAKAQSREDAEKKRTRAVDQIGDASR
jgi:hypothetical protein